jgi:flagellar protein FliO/FliZ
MNTGPDTLATAFKMLAALTLVLGGMGVFFYFSKRIMRKDGGGSGGRMIRVLASQYVGLKKNISMVEIPGAILVVGITADTIRLLTKIEDKALLDQIRDQRAGHAAGSFADQLNKISRRFFVNKNDQ